MANRYDEERGWGGRRTSPRYRASDDRYEEDYDDTGGRIFGEDRYFGSGRQGYGEGYGEGYNPSGFGSRTRFGGESGGGRRRGRSSSPYRNERRSSYGTSGGGYGDYYGSRRGYGSSGYGSRDYGDRSLRSSSGRDYGDYPSQYGGGVYGGRYPESERGFMTDRESYEGDERGWWDRTSDEIASWFGDEEAERRRMMDERRSHRGRGPRGYTRSDDRIKEDVNDELTDSWSLDASEIEVEVTNGDVVLTGTVNSRYEKRLAEDLAEDVSGVKNVENRIRVNTDYGITSTSSTTTTPGTSDTSRSRTAGQG